MVNCEDILHFVDTYLNSAQIPDMSHNGLQVEGTPHVGKIVFGVSASLALFRQAKAAGADMVLVHHGLLWGQEQALTGLFKERVAFLLKNNINLAAYHLPLDKHPVVGHNACLIRALGAQREQPFGVYHGQTIGFCGVLPQPQTLDQVARTLEAYCNTKAVRLPFGANRIESVGIVSGGAYSMLPQAIEKHLDLYITGALDEPAQEWCREGNINCLALGHYNSEKPGVLALMELIAKRFDVQTEFIDVPNPL